MRHKQILDVAIENPEASIEELASQVPSATKDLVERVLEEHGDPASDETDAEADAAEADSDSEPQPSDDAEVEWTDHGDSETQTDEEIELEQSDDAGEQEINDEEGLETQADDDGEPEPEVDDETDGDEAIAETETDDEVAETGAVTAPDTEAQPSGTQSAAESPTYPSPTELTERQHKTLRAIAESPDATQQELAGRLDVCAPTVSNRVNSIDGFDWNDRQAFARGVFDADSPGTQEETMSTTQPPELETTLDEIDERLSAIEQQMEHSEATASSTPVLDDTELTHKVVHACMQAETISEEEELRILDAVLADGT